SAASRPVPSAGSRPVPSAGSRPVPSAGSRPVPSAGSRPAPSAASRSSTEPAMLLGQRLVAQGLLSAADLRLTLALQQALPEDQVARLQALTTHQIKPLQAPQLQVHTLLQSLGGRPVSPGIPGAMPAPRGASETPRCETPVPPHDSHRSRR